LASSGKLNLLRLLVRPAARRESASHPTHELCIVERTRTGSQAGERGEHSVGNAMVVAGLWKHKTKNGDDYLSGMWGLANVVVFPNGFKEGPEDADFNLYVTSPQRAKQPAEQEQVDDSDNEPVPF
jgi:hypothetical protein